MPDGAGREPMDKFLKSFILRGVGGAAPEGNTIAGVANVMGVADRGRDVVFPYAFRGAIPAFLASGFVPVGHNWGGLPVATPTKAEDPQTPEPAPAHG